MKEISAEVKLLFDKTAIKAAIKKMAYELISTFGKSRIAELALIGIQERGMPLTEILAGEIMETCAVSPMTGSLDISMYRDDIGLRKSLPHIRETSLPFEINDTGIILVDDVLHTGRTIRAALDALTDYGRPAFIKLAVLVDRGQREFPIQADFIGCSCELPASSRIKVRWKQIDDMDNSVYEIMKKRPGKGGRK